MNILSSSIKTLRDSIKKGDISAREVTEKYLAQIEKWNPKLNAYITVNEKALDQAK